MKLGKEIKTLDNMLLRNLLYQARKIGMDEMTVMHGWILEYLNQNSEKEIFQKDIEKEFSIGRSTATNILKLMEKKGYIRREPVPYDARLKRLVLLDGAKERLQATQKLAKQLDTMTWKGITQEELDVFFEVIRKLKKNLEQEGREEDDQDAGSADQGI